MRKKLKIRRADLTDENLKGLWCALDADDSDHIGAVEMSRFMRRSGPVRGWRLTRGTVGQRPSLQLALATLLAPTLTAHHLHPRSLPRIRPRC